MFVPRFILLPLLLLPPLLPLASGQTTPPIPGLPQPNNQATGEEVPQEGLPSPTDLTAPLVAPDPNALVDGEINFRNLDGFGVAALYSKLTGKRVIVSSTAKDTEISFVQAPGLTNRDAAELLEQTLLIEGFQINPSNRNPNVVSLLAVSQPGGGASVVTPVRVIDDPANLALENGVVTYVMTFQYLNPEEAQRAFTQVYGQLRPGGTIAEVGNASSLIITEKATLIQSLLKIKEKIDVPSATVGTEWVEVRYADVQELSEQLNAIFSEQASSEQSARVQRQGAGAPPNTPQLPNLGANGNPAATGGGEESPPTVIPDARTNRILLIGRPVDLVFVRELIERWDIPSDQRNFLRRKLKFLPVSEFVSIAGDAIARTLSDPSVAAGSISPAGPNSGAQGGNQNNQNQNNPGQNNGGGGGTTSSANSLPGSDRPTAPESFLVGRTLLVTDNVTNTVLAQGPPHHLEIVERLISELDVKSEQVAISAVFGRYAVTDNLTFGVDVAKILNNNGIGFSTNNGGGGVIGRDAINSFATLINGPGLALGGFSGNFGVFVNALETYTNFKTFARPTIFTTNNKEARISSGTQIAIPTSTFQNNLGNGGQSTNIEFRDVALELLVRPLVNSADEITLEISINRNTIGEDRDVGELQIPDLLSDQLETTVTVPVGSAVLLGGLIEETNSDDESGVPILRSIPLVGKLFKNNEQELTRSELVIMIRPTIVDGEIQIDEYQQEYDRGSNISRESREDFTSGPYRPRVNSAIERQEPPARRKAMSPTQKALENKKRRLRQEAARSN